jgi:hypothetical protein
MTWNEAEQLGTKNAHLASGPLEAVRLWAALVLNFPAFDEGDSAHCLCAGDFAVHHPGRVILT